MPTFYTDVGTAQNAAATNLADLQKEGALAAAKLRVTQATLTLAGTEATSDVVKICKLPKGVRVLPHLCYVVCDDPGTTFTADIGDGGDADRYASALALGAGGGFALDEPLTGPKASYKVGDHASDDGWINATLTVSSPTAAAKVVFFLVWAAL